MDKDLTIEVQIDGQKLWRRYSLTDGQAPENMQEEVQNMVDTLLNNNEEF